MCASRTRRLASDCMLSKAMSQSCLVTDTKGAFSQYDSAFIFSHSIQHDKIPLRLCLSLSPIQVVSPPASGTVIGRVLRTVQHTPCTARCEVSSQHLCLRSYNAIPRIIVQVDVSRKRTEASSRHRGSHTNTFTAWTFACLILYRLFCCRSYLQAHPLLTAPLSLP